MQYSMSSIEDVENLLLELDLVHESMIDGDEDMLAVFIKLENTVKQLPKPNPIETLIDIQLGNIKLNTNDFSKNIIELCAEIHNMNKEEMQEELDEHVEALYYINQSNWEKYIKEKERKGLEKSKIEIREYFDDQSINAYIPSARELNESKEKVEVFDKKLQEDIDELREYQQKIDSRAKALIKKRDDYQILSESEKIELRELSKLNIELNKDINEMRKSNGEILGSNNQIGKRTMTSYDGNYNDIHRKQSEEKVVAREKQFDKIRSEELAEKIIKVAEEKLSPKQYLIFTFYFLNDFTQKEIADITDSYQPNISRDLKLIVQKLQEEFVN